MNKWGVKNYTYSKMWAQWFSTGYRKYLTSQDSNRLKVQNLKINDNTVVTFHPALIAALSQRAVA